MKVRRATDDDIDRVLRIRQDNFRSGAGGSYDPETLEKWAQDLEPISVWRNRNKKGSLFVVETETARLAGCAEVDVKEGIIEGVCVAPSIRKKVSAKHWFANVWRKPERQD